METVEEEKHPDHSDNEHHVHFRLQLVSIFISTVCCSVSDGKKKFGQTVAYMILQTFN
jgi:hypothetical protein